MYLAYFSPFFALFLILPLDNTRRLNVVTPPPLSRYPTFQSTTTNPQLPGDTLFLRGTGLWVCVPIGEKLGSSGNYLTERDKGEVLMDVCVRVCLCEILELFLVHRPH